MNDSLEESNSEKIVERLDKWDKIHLPKLNKNSDIIETISKKLTNKYDNIQYENINLKQRMSRNIPQFKTLSKNENIQKFYKTIQQEKSNVLAQNINMVKQRFDFDAFNIENKRLKIRYNSEEDKNITPILNGKSYSSRTESDELWKVGNEIGIRKRIKINSNTTEIKDKLEDLEEIKIEDRTLKLNDLKLEGNYTKVTSYDVYKSIVEKKKKLELNFRKQITKLIKEIKNKENKIEELNQQIIELTDDNEKKKTTYNDNFDVVNIIKHEVNRENSTFSFQKKTEVTRKMQDLEHLVEKSKKEYIEQKEISNKKIPLLKNQIRYYKTELNKLQEILIKVKKENIIYFKNLLKEGVDVRDVGLCWIIFRLNELGAKVEFNDFPKFLDYVNVNYLLIYSDKIIKINKLKILLDLVRNERKNIMKSINFIDSNIRNKYDEIIAKKYISIPYDNIDEYIRELFHKFKVRMGNKYIILENFHKEKDDNYLKNAQEDMRKMVPSYRSINNKSKSRNHFLTETYTFNDYNKFQLNLTPKQINTVDTIITIKNLLNQIDKEMRNLRTKHLKYFKRKYESMKLKGTSECIKYDLMFCALFGNFAVC